MSSIWGYQRLYSVAENAFLYGTAFDTETRGLIFPNLTTRYARIMQVISILGIVVGLLLTVCIGIIAHELSHAVVLYFLGIPYQIEWFPAGCGGRYFGVGVFGTWASVTPRRIPQTAPTWGVRLSSIAPFVLLVPFVLVIAGILPNPLNEGDVYTAVAIAWLGCALPSPQDFSVFWYADRALSESAHS